MPFSVSFETISCQVNSATFFGKKLLSSYQNAKKRHNTNYSITFGQKIKRRMLRKELHNDESWIGFSHKPVVCVTDEMYQKEDFGQETKLEFKTTPLEENRRKIAKQVQNERVLTKNT